jgi:hypothetical protein
MRYYVTSRVVNYLSPPGALINCLRNLIDFHLGTLTTLFQVVVLATKDVAQLTTPSLPSLKHHHDGIDDDPIVARDI